jgi:deoxyribodipyrimidine photo-lyase
VELEQAAIAKRTVDKYWESKDKQYEEYKRKIS